MTDEEMKTALIDHTGDAGHGSLSENEHERIGQHFPRLFEEDV